MREESFYDPPEILSFDEAQRLLDRGESRIVDFGGALILGDPGSVLILRRRGVCLKRGNIVGSGGLVEFAVRAGTGRCTSKSGTPSCWSRRTTPRSRRASCADARGQWHN